VVPSISNLGFKAEGHNVNMDSKVRLWDQEFEPTLCTIVKLRISRRDFLCLCLLQCESDLDYCKRLRLLVNGNMVREMDVWCLRSRISNSFQDARMMAKENDSECWKEGRRVLCEGKSEPVCQACLADQLSEVNASIRNCFRAEKRKETIRLVSCLMWLGKKGRDSSNLLDVNAEICSECCGVKSSVNRGNASLY